MKRIIIEKTKATKRAAYMKDNHVEAFYVDDDLNDIKVGDIFLGEVTDVHSGLQGAFVDIGANKRGLLHRQELVAFRNKEQMALIANDGAISNFIKKGERVIVQVSKQASGKKGPLLTQLPSIVYPNLIYLPYSDYVAVSHKIRPPLSETLREKLMDLVKNKEGGIVRTQAQTTPFECLREDLQNARHFWQKILAKADTLSQPGLLNSGDDLFAYIQKTHASEGIDEVIINDRESYQHIKENQATNGFPVKYKEEANLFKTYHIEETFQNLYKEKVWLSNGAYLFIEPTETLTVIDVNTGHFKDGATWEETAFLTNVSAVKEIARQIRLRQIGGMIVIDLINMKSCEHEQHVINVLKKALESDRVTTQIFGITKLGLLEMTRKQTPYSFQAFFKEQKGRKDF